MHPASHSIKVFGIYVLLTGAGLVIAPSPVLVTLGMATPNEIWIRVLGALALVVGYYYWSCGAANAVDFFRATVRGRPLFAALCVFLILAFQAPPQLLIFAAIDLAGAAWTWRALRNSLE